ncbi:hypothetical protein CcaverHIS641_0108260 [Cutaneotrichosporon cavernicola]|nr:hypothetical protein CcaverHIS641_0108260 [Cutaneotrichosporon cavernicola]
MGLVNRLSRPGAYIEFVLPPALLAYFLWAWRVCTSPFLAEYIADGLDLGPLVAVTYRYAATGLIASVSAVFLRLYFLPTRFASPPVPPPCISNLEVIFEVPRPKDGKAGLITHDEAASGGPLVVANCISAPILGPFTALLLLAPVTVLLLAAPVHRAVIYGARQAWASAGSNARVQAYWGWGWSWVVPAGPVARYAIGFLLAWSDIEAEDNDMGRVEIGLLWGIGNALALITAALAFWQVKQIFSGELGNDVMRARAYAKASDAVRVARAKGEQDTKALAAMERFTPEKWFFVPLEHDLYAGAVVPVLPTESPYNLGRHENFDLLVGRGRGWRWILPWNCVRSGMSTAEASVWPINGVVRARLEMEAARLLDNQSDNRT